MIENSWMYAALQEAAEAARRGEVPVGALVLGPDNQLLSKAGNRIVQLKDPTAHAEILAIREACRKTGWERLVDCTLYVTLEPCAMCAGALSLARLKTIYYGAPDPKGGAIHHGPKFYDQPTCHHRPTVIHGILEKECSTILKEFFKRLREPQGH
ncbi:MAG: nucleoside deaminase [Alphaproteobacteria bacterium]